MYAHLKLPVARHFSPLSTPTAGWLLVCALSCSPAAIASEAPDPFSTEAHLSQPAPCQDVTPDHPLDLSGVVNIALCKNPQTRQMWANSRAQAAQVGISQSSYLPGLTASFAGNRSTPGTSQRSVGLTLSYLLYDFGARAANLKFAQQSLAAAIATQDYTVQTVFLAAVQAYYQTRATQAALDAAIISERAAQETFTAANARYLAGSTTPADRLTAQTAYSQSTLNRITAFGAMKIAQGNLANILGLDATDRVTLVEARSSLPADGNKPQALEQDIAALVEQARQKRPDLLSAQAQVIASQSTLDATRAASRPSISLTAAGNQINSAGVTSQGTTLGLNLSVPLFSGYAPAYRIRAAEAQVDIKKEQMAQIRLQIALDVWTAYQNLATAMQNRLTTTDLLASAEQSEQVAVGRYKVGAGTMLDLLNAQNVLAGARQQRIQAELNWNISRAALAQAMGSLDTGLLQTLPDN